MSAELRDRWGRLQGPALHAYLQQVAYQLQPIEIDNVCLAGCGALAELPYALCSADCYEALVCEVSAYRAVVAAPR